MTSKRIFVSHGLADREFSTRLEHILAERGLEIVRPADVLRTGEPWATLTQSTIASADAFVLIVPKAGTPGANNAFFELGIADALGKPVLAVLPRSSADDLPIHLIDFLVVDAAGKPMEAVVETLIHALPVEQEAGA